MKDKLVLVVGGAGFIGSHVNKRLHREGYSTVVVDNLSRGHRDSVPYGTLLEGDLADSAFLDSLFRDYPIDAVMHFAAHIDVGESVIHPAKYYHNNVSNTLNLLTTMVRHHVKSMIFSSSAAVYGHPGVGLITEEHPCNPINPYGTSKWMIEKILSDFDIAYGVKSCSLRYFNAAGGDSEGEIKNYQEQTSHLIPRLLLSQAKKGRKVTLYGTDYPTADGTCIRDYVHVEDLAVAHVAALRRLFSGGFSTPYNLGSGRGYSVREVVKAVEAVVGEEIPVIEGERRLGDPAVLLADFTKAERELGWRPRFSLHDMISDAWDAYDAALFESRFDKGSVVQL